MAHSPAGRERLALQLILLIGRNFYHGLDPMSVAELAVRLRLPAGTVKELMELFAQSKLVLPLADEETFVLGRDPETISIKEILDCLRNSGMKTKISEDASAEESEINDLLLHLERSTTKALEGKNLQGLVVSLGPPEARR
jgi:DNA-binding IscR family transcriptional regulator